MIRIKIVQKGWAGYTGNFGITVFKDGIAECSELEAKRIGATVQVMEVDEDGNDIGTYNVAEDLIKLRKVSAPMNEQLTHTPVEEKPEEETEADEEESGDKYTREQLEAIADEEGIKGLRVIAEPLGVKSVKMVELIDKILEEQ